jgi:hypothetical protein
MQMMGGPLKPVQEVELRQTVNGWNEDQSRALYAWCRNWKQLRSIRANMSPDLWGIIARHYATGDKLPVKAAEIEGALNGRARADFLDARHGISAVEPELHDAMGKSQHPSGGHVFDRFDKRQAWRLLMDGKHHDTRGKYGFENEQGYTGRRPRIQLLPHGRKSGAVIGGNHVALDRPVVFDGVQ